MVPVLAGCSLDDRPPLLFKSFVRVERYENDSARIVKVDAWGVHVSTQSVDAGMSIGRTSRVYVYPLNGTAEVSGPCTRPADDVAELSVRSSSTTRPWTIADCAKPPVLMMDRSAGVAVRVNTNEVGIGIGGIRRDALMIPGSFRGVVRIWIDSSRVGDARVSVKESGQ